MCQLSLAAAKLTKTTSHNMENPQVSSGIDSFRFEPSDDYIHYSQSELFLNPLHVSVSISSMSPWPFIFLSSGSRAEEAALTVALVDRCFVTFRCLIGAAGAHLHVLMVQLAQRLRQRQNCGERTHRLLSVVLNPTVQNFRRSYRSRTEESAGSAPSPT